MKFKLLIVLALIAFAYVAVSEEISSGTAGKASGGSDTEEPVLRPGLRKNIITVFRPPAE